MELHNRVEQTRTLTTLAEHTFAVFTSVMLVHLKDGIYVGEIV